MTKAEALEIVLELARQNALELDSIEVRHDERLTYQATMQATAIRIVEDSCTSP